MEHNASPGPNSPRYYLGGWINSPLPLFGGFTFFFVGFLSIRAYLHLRRILTRPREAERGPDSRSSPPGPSLRFRPQRAKLALFPIFRHTIENSFQGECGKSNLAVGIERPGSRFLLYGISPGSTADRAHLPHREHLLTHSLRLFPSRGDLSALFEFLVPNFWLCFLRSCKSAALLPIAARNG